MILLCGKRIALKPWRQDPGLLVPRSEGGCGLILTLLGVKGMPFAFPLRRRQLQHYYRFG